MKNRGRFKPPAFPFHKEEKGVTVVYKRLGKKQ
jgi:hypothetical protein